MVTGGEELTYRELAARVEEMAARLGTTRRLVLLGAQRRGHPRGLPGGARGATPGPPRRATPSSTADIIDTYDPDVVLRPAGGRVVERRAVSAHVLHPDLALLLSTSGSTGSPKLVRLSRDNLTANAASIAEYLDIATADRAPTTLPMHYCYGLSVVNSHLPGRDPRADRASVVDPCFWELFRDAGATSLAGVPYTYDLLDRVGFADMELPTLRYLTQAGGRMSPNGCARTPSSVAPRLRPVRDVRATEATARMAYLPPDLAASTPSAIGVPVPGGSFRLDPVDSADTDCGELVYSGANVMLGYASRPPTSRSAALSTSCPPGTWPADRRRAVRDRRPAGPAHQAVRAAHRPRPGGERACRCRGPRGLRGGRRPLVAPSTPPRPWPRSWRLRRGGRRQCGLPAAQCRCRPCRSCRSPGTGRSTTALGAAAAADPAADQRRLRTDRPHRRVRACTSAAGAVGGERGGQFVSLGGDSLSYVEMRSGSRTSSGSCRPNGTPPIASSTSRDA